jgi:CubicO group peptidase (beta-lactamase class C family)
MTVTTRRLAVLALALGFASAHAAPTTADIDRLATRTLREFSVPGIAIGVIKDGRVVLAKGYGVREQGGTAAVDADTLFAIGSNTKAFTTATSPGNSAAHPSQRARHRRRRSHVCHADRLHAE